MCPRQTATAESQLSRGTEMDCGRGKSRTWWSVSVRSRRSSSLVSAPVGRFPRRRWWHSVQKTFDLRLLLQPRHLLLEPLHSAEDLGRVLLRRWRRRSRSVVRRVSRRRRTVRNRRSSIAVVPVRLSHRWRWDCPSSGWRRDGPSIERPSDRRRRRRSPSSGSGVPAVLGWRRWWRRTGRSSPSLWSPDSVVVRVGRVVPRVLHERRRASIDGALVHRHRGRTMNRRSDVVPVGRQRLGACREASVDGWSSVPSGRRE